MKFSEPILASKIAAESSSIHVLTVVLGTVVGDKLLKPPDLHSTPRLHRRTDERSCNPKLVDIWAKGEDDHAHYTNTFVNGFMFQP